jgi:polysaccharide export outer membrane protein
MGTEFLTRARIAVVLVAGLVVGVGAAQAPPQGQRVEPMDQLTVRAMTLPDPIFSATFQVDADGTITYPYIGKVKVQGMLPGDIGKVLGDKLLEAKIVSKAPDISVGLAQTATKEVQVSGAVRSPGSYQYAGRLTVSQALLKAQMFAPEAGAQVLLLRGGDPATGSDDQSVTLSRREIEDGGPAANVTLNDGDKLIVPSALKVTIGGYVRTPSQYVIEPNTTLRQALILAGGATEMAALNRIEVQRNGKKLQNVDLDKTIIQPGDTILVPKRRM